MSKILLNYFNTFAKKYRFAYLVHYTLMHLRRKYGLKNDNLLYESYDSYFDIVEEGHLVLRIPEFHGSFEMDFRSHILKRILATKHYEPELIEIIKDYVDPEKDVLDIGANIGLFTVLFSKIISKKNKILSIEPTPHALKFLYNNIIRNDCKDSVIIFEGVAANTSGICQLKTITGMEEYSSLGNIVHPAVKDIIPKTINVKSDTIDNLVRNFNLNPGFIKIDVEGAEYSVLKGSINTLETHKPIIVSELSELLLSSFEGNSKEILDFLKNIGYEVFNANDTNAIAKAPFEGEIIAIPSRFK